MDQITLLATRPIVPIHPLRPDFVPQGPTTPPGEVWQGITEGRAFNPGWLPYVDEKAV